MTEPSEAAFDTLIYTDCRPGQGLQGSAGLQFQARSPGAGRDAMSLVQRNLLYEPPASWMRDRRAVEEYPPSFAHIADGLFATASGVYLGREANGGREGNQLTHGIVTDDPAAYRSVRPAQLFGAPFWVRDPAPSTDCPTLSDDWEPGPFDAAAARRFVEETRGGFDLLTALLAALEQVTDPEGRRILIIAEDPVVVLRWMTVATLLIPQERAVRIGFKVFSTDPAYAAQPVVAVHPGWGSTTARVDSDSGYLVFDLLQHRWTPVSPTPEVQRRVHRFRTEDPYDVVDLVELAHETGLDDPVAALALGEAMVLPGVEFDEKVARIAVEWLRTTDPGVLAAHRGMLVDQLTQRVEQWSLAILASLDTVAASGQVPVDRVAPVRIALIEKELARATANHEVTAAPLAQLPAGAWRDEHRVDAERIVTDILRTGVGSAAFDAILRVAGRFGLGVDPQDFEPQVDAFVTEWSGHPDRAYDVAAWPCGAAIREALMQRLDGLAANGHAEQVGTMWWRRLVDTERAVDTALGRAVLAAAVAHGDDGHRLAVIRRTVGAAARSELPHTEVLHAVEALWSRSRPRWHDLQELCQLLPDGPVLPDALFDQLRLTLDGSNGPLKPAPVDLLRHLIEHRLIRASSWERRLIDDNTRLRRICENLPVQRSPTVIEGYVKDIRNADRSLKVMLSEALVTAMLGVPDPTLLPDLLRALPDEVYRMFRDQLLNRIRSDRPDRHLLTAFVLARNSTALTERDAKLLTDRVERVLAENSDRRLKPVLATAKELGGEWARDLTEAREQAQEKAKGGPRFRLWNRGEG